ncbi:hypothetical protein BDQ12DRAFT_684647 [Crucibulum laeve]|uniref:Uncharacterized protein n=1 Tax=Crucibulum laeve TaxID=68775 RepID=A0A5C3LWZ3_9AGAR|nr:hypothetical protein BDQ12DRAFT_684647 [Crucibulum laeve]
MTYALGFTRSRMPVATAIANVCSPQFIIIFRPAFLALQWPKKPMTSIHSFSVTSRVPRIKGLPWQLASPPTI